MQDSTFEVVEFLVCPQCREPVPDAYVKRLQERGLKTFACPCGALVRLPEPGEKKLLFASKVEAMDRFADHQRDFDAFVTSARAETHTESFLDWAGGDQVMLAIVFTDIVGSTALCQEIGDEAMKDVRHAHFRQCRRLLTEYGGYEIKTIGDSFLVAFKCVDAALDFVLALQGNSGHPRVHLRAGIHVGTIQVEGDDVFGGTVNFAARVVGAIKETEIWLSDRAKQDLDQTRAVRHRGLTWERHDAVEMRGFPGTFTLWSLLKPHRSSS
jgi:class 3 adenylate cyclase